MGRLFSSCLFIFFEKIIYKSLYSDYNKDEGLITKK